MLTKQFSFRLNTCKWCKVLPPSPPSPPPPPYICRGHPQCWFTLKMFDFMSTTVSSRLVVYRMYLLIDTVTWHQSRSQPDLFRGGKPLSVKKICAHNGWAQEKILKSRSSGMALNCFWGCLYIQLLLRVFMCEHKREREHKLIMNSAKKWFFLDLYFWNKKSSSIYLSKNSNWFKRTFQWFSEWFSHFNTIQESAQSLLSVANNFFRDDTRSVL